MYVAVTSDAITLLLIENVSNDYLYKNIIHFYHLFNYLSLTWLTKGSPY